MVMNVEARKFVIRLVGGRVDVMEALFSLYVTRDRMPKVTLMYGNDPKLESEYACCDVEGFAGDTLGYEGLITALMRICDECRVCCYLLSEPMMITESVYMPDAEELIIHDKGGLVRHNQRPLAWVDPDTVGSLDEFIDAVRSQEDTQSTEVNDEWLEDFYSSADEGLILRWSIARNADGDWLLPDPDAIMEVVDDWRQS